MPLILLLAIGVAMYLVAAPDRWTLAATRGAIGAIRSGGDRGRSTRSGGTRSTGSTRPRSGTRPRPGSAKPRSPRPAVPTATPDRPRSGSRIGDGIRGWIRGADAAVARRRDAHAAWKEFIDFLLRGRRERRKADTEAAEENEQERQDRTRKRTESSDAVQQIADQYPTTPTPPAPPANQTGAPMTDRLHDSGNINITELATLDQAASELTEAWRLAGVAFLAVKELGEYLLGLSERYAGATDLYKTGQMNATMSFLMERQMGSVEIEVGKLSSQLSLMVTAIQNAKAKVQESDAETGRVESARAS